MRQYYCTILFKIFEINKEVSIDAIRNGTKEIQLRKTSFMSIHEGFSRKLNLACHAQITLRRNPGCLICKRRKIYPQEEERAEWVA